MNRIKCEMAPDLDGWYMKSVLQDAEAAPGGAVEMGRIYSPDGYEGEYRDVYDAKGDLNEEGGKVFFREHEHLGRALNPGDAIAMVKARVQR